MGQFLALEYCHGKRYGQWENEEIFLEPCSLARHLLARFGVRVGCRMGRGGRIVLCMKGSFT